MRGIRELRDGLLNSLHTAAEGLRAPQTKTNVTEMFGYEEFELSDFDRKFYKNVTNSRFQCRSKHMKKPKR